MIDFEWMWAFEVPAGRMGPYLGSPGCETVRFYGICVNQTFIGIFTRQMKEDDNNDE